MYTKQLSLDRMIYILFHVERQIDLTYLKAIEILSSSLHIFFNDGFRVSANLRTACVTLKAKIATVFKEKVVYLGYLYK